MLISDTKVSTSLSGTRRLNSSTLKASRCYGIRAPTRHTLHSPFPRWRTLLLHRRIPHFAGPTPEPIHFRPQHLVPLKTWSDPIIDASSCFTFLVLIRFALPPVLRPAGLHLVPRMFSSLDSAAAPHSLRSTGPPFRFPF